MGRDVDAPIRFGSVDVVDVPVSNTYEALSDTVGYMEERIEAMTLDRVSENKTIGIGNVSKQPKVYDMTSRGGM